MNGPKGIIRCETDANPPITYITWKKDSRLFDPFSNAGMMALLNGSLLIDQVSIFLVLNSVMTNNLGIMALIQFFLNAS